MAFSKSPLSNRLPAIPKGLGPYWGLQSSAGSGGGRSWPFSTVFYGPRYVTVVFKFLTREVVTRSIKLKRSRHFNRVSICIYTVQFQMNTRHKGSVNLSSVAPLLSASISVIPSMQLSFCVILCALSGNIFLGWSV